MEMTMMVTRKKKTKKMMVRKKKRKTMRKTAEMAIPQETTTKFTQHTLQK